MITNIFGMRTKRESANKPDYLLIVQLPLLACLCNIHYQHRYPYLGSSLNTKLLFP